MVFYESKYSNGPLHVLNLRWSQAAIWGQLPGGLSQGAPSGAETKAPVIVRAGGTSVLLKTLSMELLPELYCRTQSGTLHVSSPVHTTTICAASLYSSTCMVERMILIRRGPKV